jgi:ATP-dependent 26S proteasome regulatory subunit
MVLITTNEPITSLHPAVVRPGRCLSQIEFGLLSPEQANRWLTEHNVDAVADIPTPLSQLYAMKKRGVPPRSAPA